MVENFWGKVGSFFILVFLVLISPASIASMVLVAFLWLVTVVNEIDIQKERESKGLPLNRLNT